MTSVGPYRLRIDFHAGQIQRSIYPLFVPVVNCEHATTELTIQSHSESFLNFFVLSEPTALITYSVKKQTASFC